MKTKLLPAVVSILIITSLFCPVVNAEPAPVIAVAAAAAPEIAEVVIAGITVVMSGIAALKIAENLGVTWDGAADSWERFAERVSTELEKVFAKQWIKVTSHEGKAIMTAVYECWNAAGSSGGKKDDKWYFEARRNHGKIEINTERMNEEQAVKEMGRGKDIMTLNRELAENLVTRYRDATGKAPKKLKFEGDHNPEAGKFLHLHYTAHEMRLHCWIWRDI